MTSPEEVDRIKDQLAQVAEGMRKRGWRGAPLQKTRQAQSLAEALTSETQPEDDRSIPSRLPRPKANEALHESVLERWAAAVRTSAFGRSEPPFSDMDAAEEWLEVARERFRPILGPWKEEDSVEPEDSLGSVLRGLKKLVRQVEDAYGVSLPDLVPENEVLELPREDGWDPKDLEERLEKRIPVDQMNSPHFRLARSVRQMAEYSGYRKGDLTRYVLTGEEPELPAAVLSVRKRFPPAVPRGQSAEGSQGPNALSLNRYAVLRLNAPPTAREMDAIRQQLTERWEDPQAAEKRLLAELAKKHIGEGAERRTGRADWEPVAQEWNRLMHPDGEDTVTPAALMMRFRRMEGLA